MKECSKSIPRRLNDSNFVRRYFVGKGIDIGGKPDPLSFFATFFPFVTGIETWDKENGDAQKMEGVADETYDFVFSSHCLEHVHDPQEALQNWFRILKPGGHLIVAIPDEDLYEQNVFPSQFNNDHKTSWTVLKEKSWSSGSRNLLPLLQTLGGAADIRKIEVVDETYRYDLTGVDQTLKSISEAAIEFIIRKRPAEEVAEGTRLRGVSMQVPRRAAG
jgi:SAM-dependent methyltransferase